MSVFPFFCGGRLVHWHPVKRFSSCHVFRNILWCVRENAFKRTCLEASADLLAFREHTTKIFEKHGMKNIALLGAKDEPQKTNTLILCHSHASREAATANWKEFSADPGMANGAEGSEVNGKIGRKKSIRRLLTLDRFFPNPSSNPKFRRPVRK